MSKCLKHTTALGCLVKANSQPESVVIHYTYGVSQTGEEIIKAIRYTKPDGTPIPFAIEDSITVGACPVYEKKPYEIMVVRLDGSLNNIATARPEGFGAVAGDVGNLFILNAAFYYSYDIAWLGDTIKGATVQWNDLIYTAGIGGGSAGYAYAELPIREWSGELGVNTIAIQANPGAFLELRYKKPI